MILDDKQTYSNYGYAGTNLAEEPNYSIYVGESDNDRESPEKSFKIIIFGDNFTDPNNEEYQKEKLLLKIRAATYGASEEPRLRKAVPIAIQRNPDPQLYHESEELFALGSYELAEYNEVQSFPDKLLHFIEQKRNGALHTINRFINEGKLSEEIISEILPVLGKSDEFLSQGLRRDLLLNSLQSESPNIRYGAIIGLANLEDPYALSFLRNAVRSEESPILQHLLAQVIDRLEVFEKRYM